MVDERTGESRLSVDAVHTDSRSLTPGKPLAKPVDFGPTDSLKIILTAQEGKSAKRPHQAFLLLRDAISNLDVSYPLSMKESGEAKVDLVGELGLDRRTAN